MIDDEQKKILEEMTVKWEERQQQRNLEEREIKPEKHRKVKSEFPISQTSERIVIGNVSIDKTTNNIISEKRKYIFFRKQHTVPLQEVLNVNIEHFKSRPAPGANIDVWTVYIRCRDSKRIEFSKGTNKALQFGVARALDTFLNKEVKETKSGPSLLDGFFQGVQEDQDRRNPPSTRSTPWF